MAYKNVNKRLVLKSTAIGFLLMGLFLLSYSQAVYVEEVTENKSIDGGLKVEILDALTIACFLFAFVLNLVGSFVKDSSKQLFRSSVKRMISSMPRRRGGGKNGTLTAKGVNAATANENVIISPQKNQP